MSESRITKHIVIVGGGAAGWLTAGRIASEHNSKDASGVRVSLIESEQVKTIGVGEGTWPTMRTTLQKIGISESDFVKQCDVSFKQGSKFIGWIGDRPNDEYYHPFQGAVALTSPDLIPTWQLMHQSESFAHTMSFQPKLCDLGKSPKLSSTREFKGVAEYGYHLDATKLGEFLKKHCTEQLGVEHICDHVVQVNSSDDGDIESVTTENHGTLSGDLFVDCTGLGALLIGKHYKIPFIEQKHVLFNDSALAVHVPYINKKGPIASQTNSTALTSGWVWDIGLPTRRGVGYAYSSEYISDEEASAELKAYLSRTASQDLADELVPRKIAFTPGHRATFWHKNCVAIGMSSGFLEPLEATALVLVETAARYITEQMPANREAMRLVSKRYNERMQYHWRGIIDFLKLHYVLSQRTEKYWQANRNADSIPASLQELLTFWRFHPPSVHDFHSADEFFPFASYQYILYGMGFKSEAPPTTRSVSEVTKIKKIFAETARTTSQLVNGLPSNRVLLDQLALAKMPID